MTTATAPTVSAAASGSAARRVLALARLELTMLLRNSTALFNAVMLGPLMVLLISSFSLPGAGGDRSAFAATLMGSLLVFGLVFAGYYNLCTTAVARREELMLKRLVTGELTKAEVLVAMSAPALAVILAQVVVGGLAVLVVVGVPAFVNPVLVVLGLLLGFSAMAVLGYATAIVTRTVESAQITTLMPLAVLIFLSGASFPLAMMPEPMRAVAELTPLAATGALMNLGLGGLTPDGTAVTLLTSFAAAVKPVLVLLLWTALGGYLVQRRLPWEPRR